MKHDRNAAELIDEICDTMSIVISLTYMHILRQLNCFQYRSSGKSSPATLRGGGNGDGKTEEAIGAQSYKGRLLASLSVYTVRICENDSLLAG